MIALITSTLRPTRVHSFFSEQERYDQTLVTIRKLAGKGFDDIRLIDNSINDIDAKSLINDSQTPIKVFHSAQYSFANKGLNEALMLLNNLHHLPQSIPVFKISARYFPTDQFNMEAALQLDRYDFIGVGENFDKKISAFSTRAYFVKNKMVLEEMLTTAIEEMIAYHKGVYGPRSAIRAIRSILKKEQGSPFQLSIEQAFARIMKQKNNYLLLDRINIEGTLAGFSDNNKISE
ncbi:hypothetical protein ACFQZS_04010 [Mucilaginibacter calamicampi]|uniref:Uncharacterized protein n=1 Tax=Mucilaginibacter calamicampi TaxID=1302352 RepID=A0ABW2YU96_9SPHI